MSAQRLSSAYVILPGSRCVRERLAVNADARSIAEAGQPRFFRSEAQHGCQPRGEAR